MIFSAVIIKHKKSDRILTNGQWGLDLSPKYLQVFEYPQPVANNQSNLFQFALNGPHWQTEQEIISSKHTPLMYPNTETARREIYKMIRHHLRNLNNRLHRINRFNSNHSFDHDLWSAIQDELEFVVVNIDYKELHQVDFFQECAPKKISAF